MSTTFAVSGSDKRSSVPWNIVEAHRESIEATIGIPLERINAQGGLPIIELAEAIEGDDGKTFVLESAETYVDEMITTLKSSGGLSVKHLGKLVAAFVLAASLLSGGDAKAQAVGGSASISVTSSSANVALPANKSNYPAVLITPTPDTTQEVFYAFGVDNTVAAVTTGPALPGGGICVNAGPNTYVAAITATGTATVRITQLTTCPIFARAGSSGGSPGSGTVTSVGLSLPSIFAVTGSPVTTAGTLAAMLNTQAANLIWAGPTTGAAAAPMFRSLVTADLPALACANLSDASAFCNGTNASGLTGTVASARISGAYGGITGVGTLASGAVPTTLLTGALQAAQFPALTGDITTSAGALATTLKNTGPGVTGPLGSATVAPIVTIDAQGRITALTSATITPAVGSITGLGANIATALGSALNGTGAISATTNPVFVTPALGTPASGVATNLTGLPITGLVNIAPNTVLSNWTAGSAAVVANTWPSCADTGGNHLNYVNGTGVTCGTSGGSTGITVGTTTITSGTTTRILYDNAGVVGEYTLSGTGTVVAMQGSPSLTTPNINVATGASLALGGATIGSFALAATGTASVSGNITAGQNIIFRSTNSLITSLADGSFTWFNNAATTSLTLTWPTSATWQLGAANAASVTNQIVTAQGSRVGTDTNTVGANLTIKPGVSTGNVTPSALNFNSWVAVASGSATQTDTLTMQITAGIVSIQVATDATTSTGGVLQVAGGASVAKRFWIPAITASSGLQTAVLCQSSGGEMIADSVACLASGAQFKTILGPMEDGALGRLMALPIERWRYNAEGNFRDANWTRERIGPIAQDVALLDTRLIGYDKDGIIRTYSTDQLLAFTIKAVQELNAKVDRMQIKPASAN